MPDEYNSTLNLPKTEFSMRAGLPKKEPEMLQEWLAEDLYNEMVKANEGKPLYILHDGPPYANGDIHMGHALNKVLKDIIVRYKNMSGFKAPYVPGWDTHGLPIERKAMEKVKNDAKKAKKAGAEHSAEVSDYELREICHEFAMKYVNAQSEQFQRLGVLGDFENPYITLTPEYEANQIAVFGEIAKKGYIYKGLKPVSWCASDRTALAEAEIEYEDEEVDTVYVGFQVVKDNGALEKAGVPADKAWFVIWTTTTWTLPGNVAICLGPKFEYVAARVGERYYIVAKELLKASMEACDITDYEVVATFTGAELERIETKHVYLDRRSLVIVGDHVTLESGTGCVHTAPGHGVEDYEVCNRFYPELPMVVPVDDDGKLTKEAGQFEGLPVFKASAVIQEALKESGHLVGVQRVSHSYPHCWRCHSSIIFRATEQWFCSVEDFKEETYKAVDEVKWTPEWGKARMQGMVQDRSDWCISRQRLWGVPIPVFYCDDCGKYIINDETIDVVKELFAEEGSNAWFKYSANDILPDGFKCPDCGAKHFRKERDTMDVWFDSGTSYATVLGEGSKWADHPFPADLYLEGSDQYRGWFQSSLLTSVATRGTAPYKGVLSCGWVVDEEKKKMSKSRGNGIAPANIIKDYGADIIRMWVASANYQVDMHISFDILKQISESYRKIRNTARFILGNISDFNPDTDSVPYAELPELDRWALAKTDDLLGLAANGYEQFDFHVVTHNLLRFCVVDMSNFYLDIIKDRIYINPPNSKERRAAQTTMFEILVSMTKLLAPVLAYTSQEIWQYIPSFEGKGKYVILHDIPKSGRYTLTKEESEKWEKIAAINTDVKKVLELARANKEIGSSLEAKVILHTEDDALHAFIESVQAELPDIFIVSQVELAKNGNGAPGETENLFVQVARADGEKCERCWQYQESVGKNEKHSTICQRCSDVMEQL